MGIVHSSQGKLEPASPHLKSEPAIVAGLARAVLGPRSTVDWLGLTADYDRIRADIEAVVPGFEDYNRRVRQPAGFYLPNGPREGRFPTPSGKAVFTVHPIPVWELPAGELLMMTIRTHDQFNTTIYGMDDRYRGVFGQRRVVFINKEDIRALGMKDGDWVDIQTVWNDGQERRADRFKLVAYDIPRGNLAAYYPETNPLVPLNSVALNAGTPASKSIPVILTPHTAPVAAKADHDASAYAIG